MSIEAFLELADLLPEPMLLLSGDGTVLAANQAVGTRLGLDPAALQGRRLADHVVDPDGTLAAYLRDCARSRQRVFGGIVVAGPDGPLSCRGEGAVLRPRSGDAPALVLLRLLPRSATTGNFAALNQRIDELSREITRRQRLEQELRQQREWLRVTLCSIGDAVLATDTGGRVAFMNRAAEFLTSWTQAEALDRPLAEVFDIVNEQTRAAAENPVDRVLREGTVVGLANHTVLRGRDGVLRPIDDCAAPIRDDSGRIIGAVLVFHDVSERRRLEQELSRRAEALVERDRRKDEFLSMLAHELRNPLAPIASALKVLRQAGSDPAAGIQALDILDRQTRHLSRLVEGLLEATRIVRGTIALSVECLDLGPLVRAAAEDRRPAFEQAGLSLVVEVPATPVWVRGDATRLTQVLNNLLDNAHKFTDRGQVVVRLGSDAGSRQAVVAVGDTGIGIDPEVLPRLFEVFAQADRSLERTRGGLGLGLWVARGLVELHHGEISASSPGSGRGAEFTVRLPLDPGPPAGAGEPAATATGAVGRLRILIVEDNKDSANSLRMLLELLQYEVQVAATGPEGVQAALAWRPDVVLCDIGLPGMDGYEVARQLRAEPGLAGVLLVALTGYGREEDRRRSREAGFAVHLVKPADLGVLQNVLADHRARGAL